MIGGLFGAENGTLISLSAQEIEPMLLMIDLVMYVIYLTIVHYP